MDDETPAETANEESSPGADWMAPIDGDIVELMRDDDIFTPDHIEEVGICRAADASYRCRDLAKYGLLKKYAIGMYDITDLGEQFLAGEIDPRDLEPEED